MAKPNEAKDTKQLEHTQEAEMERPLVDDTTEEAPDSLQIDNEVASNSQSVKEMANSNEARDTRLLADTQEKEAAGSLQIDNEAQGVGCCGKCCNKLCQKLKEKRLELSTLFLFLGLTGIFIRQIAGFFEKDYTYHQECVGCLGKNHNVIPAGYRRAFCNDGPCVLVPASMLSVNGNSSCAVHTDFCGAPQCVQLQILPGLRAVPLWVMFATAMINTAINLIVNNLKFYIVRPLKKCCYKFEDDWDKIEQNKLVDRDGHPVQYTDEELSIIKDTARWLDLFAATNGYMWLFLLTYSLVHFGFIVNHVMHSNAYSSGWERFQVIYGLWLNSGTMAVIGVLFTGLLGALYAWDATHWWKIKSKVSNSYQPRILQSKALSGAFPLYTVIPAKGTCGVNQKFPIIVGTLLPLIFLLPPFFVLWLPSIVVFIPMTLLVTFCWGVWFAFDKLYDKSLNIRDYKVLCTILQITGRVLGSFIVLVAVQLWTNYALLYYSGNYSWSEVIKFEYESRNTECYVNALLNKLELANLGLAGILLS